MNPAGHPYTREELTGLKRADIQRLCKDYGVRANMKTDALIELLLDSIHSNMSPLVRPPQPQPQHVPTPVRRVSTRSSSRASTLRSRGVSGSSAITSHVSNDSSAQGHPAVIAGAAPRTSKSKVMQYRLGVGRPLAAGGSGARLARGHSGPSKLKRSGNNRSIRPSEETVDEDSGTIVQPHGAHYAVQEPSRESQQTDTSLVGDHDIVVRLDRLESVIRDAGIKQQFDSLKDLPSQVAWLKASLQQREEEVMTLRGELNIYRMELIALRGDVSKVFLLQDQLRTLKEALDQLTGSASSSVIAKGKLARRVSVPLSESNTNSLSPNKTSSAPTIQTVTQIPQADKSPAPSPMSTPSRHSNASGKRVMVERIDMDEGGGTSEADPTRPRHPGAKRARIGLERRPLQEKITGSIRDPDGASHDRESSEESTTSAGTSSDPSTVPSVGTPPATHSRERFGESLDATQDVQTDEGIFNFSFRQATSSTPRDDLFNFFEEHEPFSPGSAMKAGSRGLKVSDDVAVASGLQSTHVETRRISNVAARPHTPTRSSGPDRFRVATDHISPFRDIASPFDPYNDDAFGLPFSTTATGVGGFMRNEARGPDRMVMPTSMPLALGFGLGVTSAGVLRDDTPVHPAARTMYGTELHNDTRFGDFGRDEIASTSNMNFWGPY